MIYYQNYEQDASNFYAESDFATCELEVKDSHSLWHSVSGFVLAYCYSRKVLGRRQRRLTVQPKSSCWCLTLLRARSNLSIFQTPFFIACSASSIINFPSS